MLPRSRWKSLPVPLLLMALTAGLFLWSRGQYGQAPQIETIDPQIGFPGETLEIRGRFFGASRTRGEIVIAGIKPRRSLIKEWTDQRIRVKLSSNVSSGLVVVQTEYGKSRGTLFTNRNHVPGRIYRGRDPVQPHIQGISPQSASPGSLVTITGSGFGTSRGESRIFLGRVQGGQDPLAVPGEYVVHWDDQEIRFRVPPGAGRGALTVQRRGRDSSPEILEVFSPVGRRSYGGRRRITLRTAQEVEIEGALGENGLYLRVPKPAEGYRQNYREVLQTEGAGPSIEAEEALVFHLRDLSSGQKKQLSQDFIVETAEVSSVIDPRRIADRYDPSLPFYGAMTSPGPWIPSEDRGVGWAAGRQTRGVSGSYQKARQLYDYTLERLEPARASDRRGGKDVVSAEVVLDSQRADPPGYARLLVSLLRNQGIPARPVRGILVLQGPQAVFHEWAEFYLEDFGWFPADPYLADLPPGEVRFPGDYPTRAGEFYWGGLDPFHLSFTRGILAGEALNPEGRSRDRADVLGYVQSAEEPWGAVSGYRVNWNRVSVTGIAVP